MNLRALAYSAICVIALGYLAVANARGYVPFASRPSHGAYGTATHFHK